MTIPHTDVTYRIIGAAMEVHNKLGPNLKEITYHGALSAAMQSAGLSFEDEHAIEVEFEEQLVGLLYIDHFVEGTVVVEEKAFPHLLTNEEVAQVITYLAVSGAAVGLLFNFGRKRLQYQRILPPKTFSDWRARAKRYAWFPKEQRSQSKNPIIRSVSVDSTLLSPEF